MVVPLASDWLVGPPLASDWLGGPQMAFDWLDGRAAGISVENHKVLSMQHILS